MLRHWHSTVTAATSSRSAFDIYYGSEHFASSYGGQDLDSKVMDIGHGSVFFFLSARGSILYIQVDAFRWQPVLQSHHEVKEFRANIVQYNITLAFTTFSSLGVKAEWSVLEQFTSRKEHVEHATSTLVCIWTLCNLMRLRRAGALTE